LAARLRVPASGRAKHTRGRGLNPFNIFANPWVFFGALLIVVAVVWYGIHTSDTPDGDYVEDGCPHASARC